MDIVCVSGTRGRAAAGVSVCPHRYSCQSKHTLCLCLYVIIVCLCVFFFDTAQRCQQVLGNVVDDVQQCSKFLLLASQPVDVAVHLLLSHAKVILCVCVCVCLCLCVCLSVSLFVCLSVSVFVYLSTSSIHHKHYRSRPISPTSEPSSLCMRQ
jgi:hypothetical protein